MMSLVKLIITHLPALVTVKRKSKIVKLIKNVFNLFNAITHVKVILNALKIAKITLKISTLEPFLNVQDPVLRILCLFFIEKSMILKSFFALKIKYLKELHIL